MTTLDPRGLEAAARELFESEKNTAVVEYPEWDSPENVGKPLYIEDAESAVTAYLAVTQPIVETVQALKDLPVGVVVRSAAGTIACRADESAGVVFGDDRPFPWTSLMLPARVIWRPHD